MVLVQPSQNFPMTHLTLHIPLRLTSSRGFMLGQRTAPAPKDPGDDMDLVNHRVVEENHLESFVQGPCSFARV